MGKDRCDVLDGEETEDEDTKQVNQIDQPENSIMENTATDLSPIQISLIEYLRQEE